MAITMARCFTKLKKAQKGSHPTCSTWWYHDGDEIKRSRYNFIGSPTLDLQHENGVKLQRTLTYSAGTMSMSIVKRTINRMRE